MRNHPELRPRLIHTGQHYDDRMSGRFFAELEIPRADVNLGVNAGSVVAQTAEIMVRLASVLTDARPNLVMVVGDVTSTIAAGLVANKMSLPLAHVEAGLRSLDRSMPEEINRIVTDTLADYFLTTEPAAIENLLRAGIPGQRIHHGGNLKIGRPLRR